MFKDFSRRLLDGTGGTGGAPPPAAPPPAAPPPAAWHEGKADAETVGYWQNRGLKLEDPIAIALDMTKAAREAQKFVGVPPDRLVRLPEKPSDEAGWNAVYQRLGAPADPKEYDFSAVKRADGAVPDAALLDTMRATAAALRVAKDKAPDLANAVVKYLDGQKAETAAVAAAKLATEKADLAKSWGPNAEMNKLQAIQGAKRLGVDPDTVTQLENVVGYAKIMEMFRKIGAGTTEETFVEGGGTGAPVTAGAAQARLNELMNDAAWGKRLLSGDAAAVREFNALTQQVAA
jgi:hypothetical protein